MSRKIENGFIWMTQKKLERDFGEAFFMTTFFIGAWFFIMFIWFPTYFISPFWKIIVFLKKKLKLT